VGEHRCVTAHRLGEAGQNLQGGRAERDGERLRWVGPRWRVRGRHQWMWARQSGGTRPAGPGTGCASGREVGAASTGPSTIDSSP